MDGAQFRQWQALLETRTGVCVSEQRQVYLQTSLGARMRELGMRDYQLYYEYVTEGISGALEWSALVEWLTVRETSFMRHRASFDCVAQFLAQRQSAVSDRPLQFWSVGCASGEEAYSLAIVMEQSLVASGQKRRDYGIWATDISQHALDQARNGCYPDRRLGGLGEREREQWLERLHNGQYRVVPALRDRVCFTRLNILELAQAPIRDLDIIFCQNLLIYFRRWRRRDLLNQLAMRLAPGGILVIGPGEIMDWNNSLLERVPDDRVQAYRRRDSMECLE
ncbi:CheR family methyltransferase [Halopseudomonas litoralis]|nr:CheR family methyltransferase [Halopseudomonas litoralis]